MSVVYSVVSPAGCIDGGHSIPDGRWTPAWLDVGLDHFISLYFLLIAKFLLLHSSFASHCGVKIKTL